MWDQRTQRRAPDCASIMVRSRCNFRSTLGQFMTLHKRWDFKRRGISASPGTTSRRDPSQKSSHETRHDQRRSDNQSPERRREPGTTSHGPGIGRDPKNHVSQARTGADSPKPATKTSKVDITRAHDTRETRAACESATVRQHRDGLHPRHTSTATTRTTVSARQPDACPWSPYSFSR